MRATGVRIHLDFGVDPLSPRCRRSDRRWKIDRLLVAGCARDEADGAIVRAAIELARGLRLQVTAEWVESAAQLDFVRALGCDRAQGGYFSMPVPPEDLSGRLGKAWH